MTNEVESLTGWVLAGIGAVISTLLTGVIGLFRMREAERDAERAAREAENTQAINELKLTAAKLENKSDKCEADRTELYATCKVLEEKVHALAQRVNTVDNKGVS